ncbi:beta-ketoacyl-ACP synthase III [Mariniblastus fucicola]|uniref:Beta-ketoacyl-[acyl-carrier-protein] synthase III n=1 Tax=Mariniblastus fucicola TaxID=980251 RepID=A0A5B9PH21_9BACT|nr:beta-ketoacyl-ACP synthase III [Mariniblastus fucicola]QEG24545.1 3-oxoacyl-[acyl-carrier-protein] synthase 3 [Mariniblastus fucicola]
MSNTIPPDAVHGPIFPVPLSKEALSRRVKEIAGPLARRAAAKPRKSLPGIRVMGTGIATGSQKIDNCQLAELGCDSDWIVQRTGIQSRFHTGEDQAVSDMCIAAAKQCLANAKVDPKTIDLIVIGTMTADHASPSTACMVQAALDCPAMAMDLNAACSGFVYSMITASQFITTGSAKRALVVGADMISMLTDPKDLKTYPLFGDGAGAVLLTSDTNPDQHSASGILDFHLAAEGKLGHTLLVPAGGSRLPLSQDVLDNRMQYLKMDGRPVFKWAVRTIPEAVHGALDRTGMTLDDIDVIIPHQANIRIIDAAIETLGIPSEKVFVNVDRYGNTSAASIPIALHEAVEQGRIERGSNVLLVGFGAGLTWGSCLLRW